MTKTTKQSASAAATITTVGDIATACKWCGMTHDVMCPKVKRIDYYSDGNVKSVEFFELTKPMNRHTAYTQRRVPQRFSQNLIL